jgi:hypothetical protein
MRRDTISPDDRRDVLIALAFVALLLVISLLAGCATCPPQRPCPPPETTTVIAHGECKAPQVSAVKYPELPSEAPSEVIVTTLRMALARCMAGISARDEALVAVEKTGLAPALPP